MNCGYCGNAIVGKRRDAKWCSERCRRDNYEKRGTDPCRECGGPVGHRRGSLDRRCLNCRRSAEAAAHHARALQIVEWWGQGLSYREMANRLGWSSTSDFSAVITPLREEGYDLPYRYPAWEEKAAA